MPEYVLAFILSACVGGLGWINRRIDLVDSKVDALEVKAAELYVTKDQLDKALTRLENQFLRFGDRLEISLLRMEDKLDAHVSEDRSRINNVIQKYNLNDHD